LTNKNDLLKKNHEFSTHQAMLQDGQEKRNVGSPSNLKIKKSRIYYEETHPPTSKKSYENLFQSKKAIKQKKFPILF